MAAWYLGLSRGRYPTSKAKKKPQQDGRRVKCIYNQTPYTRHSEGSSTLCAQDPETPQETGNRTVLQNNNGTSTREQKLWVAADTGMS